MFPFTHTVLTVNISLILSTCTSTGYIHYKEEKYSDCILMLKPRKDNSDETIGYTDNDFQSLDEEYTLGHDAARIQALSNNLSALCLSKMVSKILIQLKCQ